MVKLGKSLVRALRSAECIKNDAAKADRVAQRILPQHVHLGAAVQVQVHLIETLAPDQIVDRRNKGRDQYRVGKLPEMAVDIFCQATGGFPSRRSILTEDLVGDDRQRRDFCDLVLPFAESVEINVQ